MDPSSDSDDELFPIVNNQAYLNTERIFFVYDDPLLVSGILRAVVEENIDNVKLLIESGKSVNINDNNGNTPLHIAVLKNNLDILKYLLDQDAIVVNVRNFRGETPLYYAVSIDRYECTKILIQAGANVNLPDNEDITPLHKAVSFPKIAHLLIMNGAKIDAVDYSGDTPLHDAASVGCTETVCMLLFYNADANMPGGNNLTPFMKALISESHEIQHALFEYVDNFNVSTDDNMNTLAIALTSSTPYIEEMIKRGVNVNYVDMYEDENLESAFNLCLSNSNCNIFKLIWERIRYNEARNSVDLCLFFEYMPSYHIENYLRVIIESNHFKPAVKSFTRNNNYFVFINKFAENHLNLEQLTIFTCCLLQCEYRTTSNDIYAIFSNFGYCELIRILLYMDNDYTTGWLPYMHAPRLIFDIEYKKPEIPMIIYKRDLQQLLEFFIHPPLVFAVFLQFKNDVNITELLDQLPRVPSLLELARNMARIHIIKCKNIQTTCQLYTIINHLNIPTVYRKILSFEKKIYYLE